MKKIALIIILIILSTILFAENTPKEVTTYLTFTNGGTHPASNELSYEAWLTERSGEVIDESTLGASLYDEASGFLTLRLQKFAHPWNPGEHLVVKIYVEDGSREAVLVGEGTLTIDNTTPQQMENINLNDTDDPLAVTLASFAAVYTGEGPKLQWTTLSETNNNGWNIYRSLSDDYAVSIKVNAELIEGAGTTTNETSYEFFDEMDTIADTTYWYWLESVENSGQAEVFDPIMLQIPVDGNEGSPDIPVVIGLHGNYPNPFNPSTTISFALDEEGPYTLSIYNIKGQKVLTHNDEITSQNAGKVINFVWEGTVNQGKKAASGVYFYTLQSKTHKDIKKMILIK